MLATERPDLRFTTTVAREYVHRVALSEVFLTGWSRTGLDKFTVQTQWPRSHSFYAPINGMHDPLLLCETIRQTFPLLCHAAYEMPFGHQLSWSAFQYTINPQAMRIERAPAEVDLHVSCSDIRYQRGTPSSMSMHIEATRDGTWLAVSDTRFECMSPKVYQRLRSPYSDTARVFAAAPTPVPSLAFPGRPRNREDVVLSPTQDEGRFQLRVDTSHPVLFDHPVDHVPGMLLLEAVRQAGHLITPDDSAMMPSTMDVTFHRYVEFDAPTWVTATPLSVATLQPDTRSYAVKAHQNNALAFTATAGLLSL